MKWRIKVVFLRCELLILLRVLREDFISLTHSTWKTNFWCATALDCCNRTWWEKKGLFWQYLFPSLQLLFKCCVKVRLVGCRGSLWPQRGIMGPTAMSFLQLDGGIAGAWALAQQLGLQTIGWWCLFLIVIIIKIISSCTMHLGSSNNFQFYPLKI